MSFDTLATIASFSAAAIALAAQAILVMFVGTRWAAKGTADENVKSYQVLLVLSSLVLFVGFTIGAFLVGTDLLGKSARELSLTVLAGIMTFATFSMHQWLNQLDKE